MIEEMTICKKCCEEVMEFGEAAFEYYEYVCKNYNRDTIVFCPQGIFGRGHPTLAFLERKGFIISTDAYRFVFIKPVGYNLYKREICAFRTKHKNK